MNDKNYNNIFKFALYQEDVLFCSKMFNADLFNPFTRYSIDIRELLPRAITRLQKILSKKRYETSFENYPEYDFFRYNQRILNSYPPSIKTDLKYHPETIIQEIENKTIKGVECKIGFYINENPIVERLFYVDGFNPVSRWSVDVTEVVIEIANSIFELIKRKDIQNMWDDYDLINVRGLSINQIRELSPAKRSEQLRRIRRN